MMKDEFEKKSGVILSNEDWERIETVYMNYPNIDQQEDIIKLYNKFGMTIINDMHHRANEISKINRKIDELKRDLILLGTAT